MHSLKICARFAFKNADINTERNSERERYGWEADRLGREML